MNCTKIKQVHKAWKKVETDNCMYKKRENNFNVWEQPEADVRGGGGSVHSSHLKLRIACLSPEQMLKIGLKGGMDCVYIQTRN